MRLFIIIGIYVLAVAWGYIVSGPNTLAWKDLMELREWAAEAARSP